MKLMSSPLILCVQLFSLHVCLCTICVRDLWKPEGNLESPETRETATCEPLCGRWILNSGPEKEQPELLTVELSLQLRALTFQVLKSLSLQQMCS